MFIIAEDGSGDIALVRIALVTTLAFGGTLVLPFGLNLGQGAVLFINEGEFPSQLQFSTCLPVGYLVPLTFDPEIVAAMQIGTALKVRTAASDRGQEIDFSISLAGFTSAFVRVAELAGLWRWHPGRQPKS